jgi:hypothetical protein
MSDTATVSCFVGTDTESTSAISMTLINDVTSNTLVTDGYGYSFNTPSFYQTPMMMTTNILASSLCPILTPYTLTIPSKTFYSTALP